MAPKDNQRVNEDTMKASSERLNQINTSIVHTAMPTDLEYAVMRLRSAAYALKEDQRDAAFTLARDAFLLADAAFSAEDRRKYGSLVTTMPETTDGITQQVERVKTVYVKTTESKVLFSPWTWLKLKVRRRPTIEIYTDGRKVWPAQ